MRSEPKRPETPQAYFLEIFGVVSKMIAVLGVPALTIGTVMYDLSEDERAHQAYSLDYWPAELSLLVVGVLLFWIGERAHSRSYYKDT